MPLAGDTNLDLRARPLYDYAYLASCDRDANTANRKDIHGQHRQQNPTTKLGL